MKKTNLALLLVFLTWLTPVLASDSKRARPVKAEPFGVVGGDNRSIKPKQIYPGVGATPGDSRPTDADVIVADGRRNEIVYISSTHPSRISTPFKEPKLIDNSVVQSSIMGQSIYVTPRYTDRPLGVFVTGSGENDPVISLTLIPRDIPPKTVVLQLEEPPAKVVRGEPEAVLTGDAPSYVDYLRDVLRAVTLGEVPPGFAKGASPQAVARSGDLLIQPDIRYSGAQLDIYRYKIESMSKTQALELSEAAFWQQGVRAVSLFPAIRLQPGESTYAFVVVDKTAFGGAQ